MFVPDAEWGGVAEQQAGDSPLIHRSLFPRLLRIALEWMNYFSSLHRSRAFQQNFRFAARTWMLPLKREESTLVRSILSGSGALCRGIVARMIAHSQNCL
jgi:hypothetical protein